VTWKMLDDKHGPVQNEGIYKVLKAWFTCKDWEEPTPLSVARVYEYIRILEKKQLTSTACREKIK